MKSRFGYFRSGFFCSIKVNPCQHSFTGNPQETNLLRIWVSTKMTTVG